MISGSGRVLLLYEFCSYYVESKVRHAFLQWISLLYRNNSQEQASSDSRLSNFAGLEPVGATCGGIRHRYQTLFSSSDYIGETFCHESLPIFGRRRQRVEWDSEDSSRQPAAKLELMQMPSHTLEGRSWVVRRRDLYWNCFLQLGRRLHHLWLRGAPSGACLWCRCPLTWTFGTTHMQCCHQLFLPHPHSRCHGLLQRYSAFSSSNASREDANDSHAVRHISFCLIIFMIHCRKMGMRVWRIARRITWRQSDVKNASKAYKGEELDGN